MKILSKMLLCVFLLAGVSMFAGCDEVVIKDMKFKFPDAKTIMGKEVTGYKIQLIDPITTEVIVEVEGVPGEVVVQTVVIPFEQVKVNVVAFSYAEVIVEVDEQVDVDVVVHACCEVVVDVNVDTETGDTTVLVSVQCPENMDDCFPSGCDDDNGGDNGDDPPQS